MANCCHLNLIKLNAAGCDACINHRKGTMTSGQEDLEPLATEESQSIKHQTHVSVILLRKDMSHWIVIYILLLTALNQRPPDLFNNSKITATLKATFSYFTSIWLSISTRKN